MVFSSSPFSSHQPFSFSFSFTPNNSNLNNAFNTIDTSKPRIHRLAVDAIAGAVGEVAALMVFFPIDTIKTRLQVGGQGALRDVFSQGPSSAIRTLYAGMGTTALGAAAVGSLYLLTFYAAKRAGQSFVSTSSDSDNVSTSNSSRSGTTPWVGAVAAVAASAVGSLIEAPIESFKVKKQAGVVAATAMLGMSTSLYSSLLPFLLKSIPHDVAELCTFSHVSEHLHRHSSSGSGTDNKMPLEARDMAIGAVAAGVAAIASMPFDVIFTRLNVLDGGVGSAVGGPVGIRRSLAVFANTTKSIVVQGGGVGALFVGVVPRLVQTVPSGMLYWCAVEATRRALESKFNVVGSSSTNSTHSHPAGGYEVDEQELGPFPAPQQQQLHPSYAAAAY